MGYKEKGKESVIEALEKAEVVTPVEWEWKLGTAKRTGMRRMPGGGSIYR